MKAYNRNHCPEMFLKLPKYLTGTCWYCIIGELQTVLNTSLSLVAHLVKNPPAMQGTPVRFLGWEDPLEKG